ncbi:MAG: prefoldin subunit alpha [Candidatus Thermoplasmatota archaeon]
MAAAPQGAPKGPSEAELREVVLRGEQLRQQLAAMEDQRELVMDLAGDARRALGTLEHLTTAKEGEDTLVPLGAGAFIHARIQDHTHAITNLGSGIHAELPVAESRDRMKARVENLDGAMSQLNKDISRVAEELSRINAVLEQVYGGA